ncbi:MAG: Fic family protein [Kordiimonas sp.]
MKWNWQQEDWPEFHYDSEKLAPLEARFLKESGLFLGAYKHVADDQKQSLIIDMISDEAVKTSEIEGEFLNRDSIQSSIRRQFGFQQDLFPAGPAEEGIAEMMVDLYQNFDQPLTHDMLHRWHEMVTRGERNIRVVGNYRQHEEPMQVVSGALYKPVVHFEAPPSDQMQNEMGAFIRWFNNSKSLPALTRAGLTHLYFVCIHPYEDGNGRIGRALTEKALAEAGGQPTLIALSQTIEQTRKAYYQHLEANNKELEITDWLTWFAETILNAQNYSERLLDFIIAKTRMLDRLKGKLNARQEKVMLRLFKAGLHGFKGGLSAKNYMTITDALTATATRDLTDLVKKEALFKTGQFKGTRYWLNVPSVREAVEQE